MTARPEYLADLLARTRGDLDRLAIGDDDLWLRAPFGDAIFFEDDAVSAKARPIVEEALEIIAEWGPALAIELRQACRAIQFVRDPLAHHEQFVSFIDNSIPGSNHWWVWLGE